MKRLLIGLIVLAVLLSSSCVFADENLQPLYSARAALDFHLWDQPEHELYVVAVPDGSTLHILEWGDEWCFAQYQGKNGYCRTRWLYMIRALDPASTPLPVNPCAVQGIAVMLRDQWIETEFFEGLTIPMGMFVCAAMENDQVLLPVWREMIEVDHEKVLFQPFADVNEAEAGDIIGGFTTYYGSQQGKELAAEREFNILLGCERIHDTVIPSGGSFSFNALCAPYTASNNYQYAPNISEDNYGYGGGICQLTTTLYNAVLSTPMRIDEWEVHRYIGVMYVPQFFDAAVGSYSDLKFTNTLPYAVRLIAEAADGIINVTILRAE